MHSTVIGYTVHTTVPPDLTPHSLLAVPHIELVVIALL